MTASIDNALKIQFSDMIHVKAQQIKARLRPYVNVIPMHGDKFAYDGIGDVEAREVKGRIQPVVFQDIEHFRRKIRRRRFEVTLPIDASDIRGALLDPKGPYASACVFAMERVFDRLVVEAMFADVFTGRDFENQVSASDDGVISIDASTGLTYDKMLEIKQAFIDEDVGNDMPEKFVMGISGDEHTDLMSEIKLTSGDYSRQYSVDKGEIQNAVGFDLVKFAGKAKRPILPVNSSNIRSCFAASTRGIVVGISATPKLKVVERDDYIETTQVQLITELGAVRTEGKLIKEVKTTATAAA
jgi:hypothetical protein